MLWYKTWFETRWRILMPVAMMLAAIFQLRAPLNLQPGTKSILNVIPLFWFIASIALAGSGIRTEAPFRAQKGTHGSMYFTLGLPVSRLRLLAERALVGMLEVAGIVIAMCLFAWFAMPTVNQQVSLGDGLAYVLTVLLASVGIFGMATLLSTFLDQQWQVFGGMGVLALMKWVFQKGWLPESVDVIGAMGNASPLVTHQIQWTPLGVSVAAGALFFMGALKVVQKKEY